MNKTIIYLILGILSIYFIFFYETDELNINNYDKDEIYEFKNFLSDEECSYIINKSRPLVKKSKVIGEGGKNIPDKVYRTSHNTFLPRSYDIVQNIYDKLSKIIGIDSDHFEQLQVVRYEPGQQYKAHWDACWEEGKCNEFMKQGGQRYATFLLYLNDDFTGGETEFPHRNIKIKP